MDIYVMISSTFAFVLAPLIRFAIYTDHRFKHPTITFCPRRCRQRQLARSQYAERQTSAVTDRETDRPSSVPALGVRWSLQNVLEQLSSSAALMRPTGLNRALPGRMVIGYPWLASMVRTLVYPRIILGDRLLSSQHQERPKYGIYHSRSSPCSGAVPIPTQ